MKFAILLILLVCYCISGAIKEDVLELINNKNIDSALAIAQKELIHDPGNIFFINVLGQYSSEGHTSKKWLEKAINSLANNPQKDKIIFQSGQYYYAAGQYSKAAEQFDLYISKFGNGKNIHSAYYWSGISYLNISSSDSTSIDSAEIRFLDLLKSQSPGNSYYSSALEGLAKVRIKKSALESAFETVKMAMENSPKNMMPNFYYLLFQISDKMEDRLGKEHFKQKLLKNFPSSFEAHLLSLPARKSGSPKIKAKKGGIALQFGAYLSRENAQSALEKLKSQKIESYLFPSRKDGKEIYLIHSKIFSNRQDAEKYGKATLSSKGISYFIIQKD